MKKINLRAIPQDQVKAIATRFVGNTLREVSNTAKRKGVKAEPVLVESKLGLCVAYYPNAELIELAVELEAKRQTEMEAAINLAEKQERSPLSHLYKKLNAKLVRQGITFK